MQEDQDDDDEEDDDNFDQGSGHSQNPFETNEFGDGKMHQEDDQVNENEVILPTQSSLSLANQTRECPAGHFACRTGSHLCLEQDKQCDGVSDCDDGSDELDCYDATDKNIECRAFEEFKCFDGKQCVGLAKRCDQHVDCLDGSDEFECQCSSTQFQCKQTFECIEKRYRCDRKYDCQDGTDERHCGKFYFIF